jgi:thiamine biosynthesis lipoprotein
MSGTGDRLWQRRARPLLGTLVEIGVLVPENDEHAAAIDAAFAVICEAQASLSRFDPSSDISRFNALHSGETHIVRPASRQVLAAAHELQGASDGMFDISLGSAPDGWALSGHELTKLSDRVRLDLGGIGKGHAVDLAVQKLCDLGCTAGWVNAGGDLRAFGETDVPLHLRREASGGVRSFALLRDGAFATSAFGPEHRAQLVAHRTSRSTAAHVSVAAPLCLWADALTKVVAGSGDAAHPLLARYGAQAWLHCPP